MREEVEDPVDKSDEFLPQIAGMVLAAEGAEAAVVRRAAVHINEIDAGDPAVFCQSALARRRHRKPLIGDVKTGDGSLSLSF